MSSHTRSYKLLARLLPHIMLLIVALLLVQCKVTKYVPEGKYLLKDNKLKVSGDKIDEEAAKEILRQQPNISTASIKFRLIAYNMIRPEKAEKARLRRLKNINEKNAKLKKPGSTHERLHAPQQKAIVPITNAPFS